MPLVPIALATGWSALVLWLLGRAAEPDVGGAQRARDRDLDRVLRAPDRALPRRARERSLSASDALERTYASTGAAVLASGVTAIAGFAVLIASDIAMLRDFGLVTVIDLAVSLLGVLIVLPAVLVLAERRVAAGDVPGRRRAGPRGMKARPGLLLAVFVVALLGWVTLNSVATETAGSEGLQAGDPLPPFAMPLTHHDVPRALRRQRGHGGRAGRGRRAAGVLGARHGRPELVRAGRGRAVRARVRVRAGRALPGADPGARARRGPPSRRQVPHRRGALRRARTLVLCARTCPSASTTTVPWRTSTRSSSARRSRTCAAGGRVAGSTVGPLDEAAIEDWVARIER